VFLTDRGVEKNQPPCSTALATADFFLFSAVKIALIGSKFQAVDGVKTRVIAELNAILWAPSMICVTPL